MDFNALRIFIAVAEQGSVTKAARQLNYVQSNVTTRLRNLENEVGTKLFLRRSRGMVLTAAGEKLLSYARKMMALTEEARRALAESDEPQGSLVVGSTETTAAIRLPRFLAEYHCQYPQVEITLKTGTTAELRQMVLDYTLDGAFVGGAVEHSAIVEEQIFEEEMVLVSKEGGSGLDDPNSRALLGFRQGCSYQDRLEDWLNRIGRPPLKIMEFGTLEAILGCVSAGMGVALMPKSIIERHWYGNSLTVHPVPEPLSKIPTMFIRRRDMKPSAALNAFLKLVSKDGEKG